MMKRVLILFLLLHIIIYTHAQVGYNKTKTDSVKLYFKVGSAEIEPVFENNGKHIKRFSERLRTILKSPYNRALKITIKSSASPEGNTEFNNALSKKRAEAARSIIDSIVQKQNTYYSIISKGIDWEKLELYVEKDKQIDNKHKTLSIIRSIPEWIVKNRKVVDGRKRRLGMTERGKTWRYLQEKYFSQMRMSNIHLSYDSLEAPIYINHKSLEKPNNNKIGLTLPTKEKTEKTFLFAIKNNLIYDCLLLPNIGAEIYLGKNWTIAGNWIYAWFKNDKKHYYHRLYGGDLEVRQWFGFNRKKLTGHHIGVYGQILTYDIERGHKGYLGDKWSYGAGISYGYSLPIIRRLNLDLTLGAGYIGGKYEEYIPEGNKYVWKATKQRHWFGPTKAEISLVWLIGSKKISKRKGADKW